ncbi:unnamed protein product [Nezara viridula]|uniref:Uncharacterized protein n=1 Tax=Nezara viridula TaxID=85310 RepID=A0A9P0HIB7_NEZVI|nr:unnamed protein product [Nezara viridula]
MEENIIHHRHILLYYFKKGKQKFIEKFVMFMGMMP